MLPHVTSYYRWQTAPRSQYSADESSCPASPETIEADESSSPASIQPPSSLHPASPQPRVRPRPRPRTADTCVTTSHMHVLSRSPALRPRSSDWSVMLNTLLWLVSGGLNTLLWLVSGAEYTPLIEQSGHARDSCHPWMYYYNIGQVLPFVTPPVPMLQHTRGWRN